MGNELFKNIPSKVGDLVKDVRNGRIGLPESFEVVACRTQKPGEMLYPIFRTHMARKGSRNDYN